MTRSQPCPSPICPGLQTSGAPQGTRLCCLCSLPCPCAVGLAQMVPLSTFEKCSFLKTLTSIGQELLELPRLLRMAPSPVLGRGEPVTWPFVLCFRDCCCWVWGSRWPPFRRGPGAEVHGCLPACPLPGKCLPLQEDARRPADFPSTEGMMWFAVISWVSREMCLPGPEWVPPGFRSRGSPALHQPPGETAEDTTGRTCGKWSLGTSVSPGLVGWPCVVT